MPHAVASQPDQGLTPVGLEALRYCESRNDYTIDTGNGYYGAYQFDQRTWDATMEWIDEPHWVGIRPNVAPIWLQDYATLWLWNNAPEGIGLRRWPVCHRVALEAMALTPDKRVAIPDVYIDEERANDPETYAETNPPNGLEQPIITHTG